MPRSSGPCAWRPPQDARELTPGLDLGADGRDAPVGRVDDQGRPAVLERVAPLEPDAQAVADACLERRGLELRLQARALGGEGRLPLRRLFRGQRGLPGQLRRPLHRRRRREVPDALQVGLSVGGARHVALSGGDRRCERQGGAGERDEAHGCERSMDHAATSWTVGPGSPGPYGPPSAETRIVPRSVAPWSAGGARGRSISTSSTPGVSHRRVARAAAIPLGFGVGHRHPLRKE